MTTAAAPSIKRRLSVDQDNVTKREGGRGREPKFCAFFACKASRRCQSPSHNPVKVTTAIEGEERGLMGISGAQSTVHSFSCRSRRVLSSLPLSAVLFSLKAA